MISKSNGETLVNGQRISTGSLDGGSCLPFRVFVTGAVGDERDAKVPLIGDGRIEPLSCADTEALVEAAEEAVWAESANPIDLHGRNPFSTRQDA